MDTTPAEQPPVDGEPMVGTDLSALPRPPDTRPRGASTSRGFGRLGWVGVWMMVVAAVFGFVALIVIGVAGGDSFTQGLALGIFVGPAVLVAAVGVLLVFIAIIGGAIVAGRARHQGRSD